MHGVWTYCMVFIAYLSLDRILFQVNWRNYPKFWSSIYYRYDIKVRETSNDQKFGLEKGFIPLDIQISKMNPSIYCYYLWTEMVLCIPLSKEKQMNTYCLSKCTKNKINCLFIVVVLSKNNLFIWYYMKFYLKMSAKYDYFS